MANDNDRDDIIPGPDEPGSAAEREQAESFASLLDDAIAGKAPPPAMATHERALLEVATMVRACAQDPERHRLGDTRRDSIIDAAMKQVSATVLRAVPDSGGAGDPPEGVTPLRPRRIQRAAPWMVTLVAAAAAVALWVTRPDSSSPGDAPVAATSSRAKVRADALVGRIDPKASAQASKRLDIVYADRLSRYRDARLSKGDSR